MKATTSGRGAAECDAIAPVVAINMAETIKTNYCMASSRKHRHDDHRNTEPPAIKRETANTEHSSRTAECLQRQSTKYPHRLNTSIQTITNEPHITNTSKYNSDQNLSLGCSQSPSLCSSWDGNFDRKHHTKSNSNEPESSNNSDAVTDDSRRKYRVDMISRPEHFTELQMRRHKYPLIDNYYLDVQDATIRKLPPPLPVLRKYLKHYGRWKYLRWPTIFLVGSLLVFGLIMYCIWLHDVSMARERYQQRRQELSREALTENSEAQFASTIKATVIGKIVSVVDNGRKYVEESTISSAVNSQTNQPRENQNLRKFEFAESLKNTVTIDKELHTDRTLDRDEPVIETSTYASAEAALVPTTVLHYGRFDEQQTRFGVPIEEKQRILRLPNNVFSPDLPLVSTTKALAKVSPTVPPFTQSTHALSSGFRTTPQDNGCYSTSLPMCRGVLDYDLTFNSTLRLQLNDERAFQKLMESNCSMRALEFVCATLEPECRPSHIGILPPCRRICKAVLEVCSVVITNWDTLNELFDCTLYPDSNDPHKCEDPTRRRGYCYDNEFACYDHTCIPQKWHCDNIKDCAAGEDEDSCLVCDHRDEFRCHSNDKCIPESMRCDLKYDCFDGSDEEECDEYGSAVEEISSSFDETMLNSLPRIFSYASFQSPNQTNEGLYAYITADADNESDSKFQAHEIENRTSGISTEEVANIVPGDGPKGFVNFRESKEIMMASDTENKLKYSSATGSTRKANANHSTATSTYKVPFRVTTPFKPAASMQATVTTERADVSNRSNDNRKDTSTKSCAPHQLRCVSGECITVNQLCDKKIDCPDGADELMCVYKELRHSSTTIIRNNTESAPRSGVSATTSTIARTDKRSLKRGTIERKIKT